MWQGKKEEEENAWNPVPFHTKYTTTYPVLHFFWKLNSVNISISIFECISLLCLMSTQSIHDSQCPIHLNIYLSCLPITWQAVYNNCLPLSAASMFFSTVDLLTSDLQQRSVLHVQVNIDFQDWEKTQQLYHSQSPPLGLSSRLHTSLQLYPLFIRFHVRLIDFFQPF